MTLAEKRTEFQKIRKHIAPSVFEKHGNKCVQCGSTENLQVDHITALSLGGENENDNYQVLCKACNCKKGGKRNDKYHSNSLHKERTQMLPKRFNSKDVDTWQAAANEETGGNLTLWMELTLNEAAKKYKRKSKK